MIIRKIVEFFLRSKYVSFENIERKRVCTVKNEVQKNIVILPSLLECSSRKKNRVS